MGLSSSSQRKPIIAIGDADRTPPFPIDAIVVEEDSWLVLSAPPEARELRRRPGGLLRAATESLPLEPGSVFVQSDATPARIYAVVHDLSLEPTIRSDWISAALMAALQIAAERSFSAVALPVLGAQHGIATRAFTRLLERALLVQPSLIERIWLQIPLDTPLAEITPVAAWIPPG